MSALHVLRLRLLAAAGLFIVMAAAALTAVLVDCSLLLPMIVGLLPIAVWLGVTHPQPPRRHRA